MAKKSRQRKVPGKRPPETTAGKINAGAPSMDKPWWIAAVCVVLILATVLSYRGVWSNDFVSLDDSDYLVHNPPIQHGVNAQSIEWAFTAFHSANWHPLTWISHMIDWQIYGNHAGGHHITNLCLHCANAVLLFLLLLYMTGFVWRSAIVAFLFALHPAHVESVAWISERKDLLCTFFWFASLLAYAWYVRKPSWKRFLWVVCGFACALMSKPMAVTLPFTLLLLDYWPLHRLTFAQDARTRRFSSLGKLCVEKWPLFIMTALSSVVTFMAQRAGGAVYSIQFLPLWARLANAAVSYCRYIRIMFWPDPLIAYYFSEKASIAISAVVLSLLALSIVTAVCWRFKEKRPYCLFGWLWFLGTLVPVIGIVQVGDQALAERYTYVSFIGLFIAIVWLVGDAVANSPNLKIATLLLAFAVIVACAIKTDAQIKVWKDTITLFSHVLEVDQRGELPNLSLGIAYVQQHRTAEAQEYLERALLYDSSSALALSYSALGLMQPVIQSNDRSNLPIVSERLEKAMRIHPNDPDVLTDMAVWSSLMNRPKDEETYSRRAIAAKPDFTPARLYLAESLQAQNRLDDAVQVYHQIFAIDPKNYQAHNELGNILDKQGFTGEAMKEFQLSLEIKPDQAMPHFGIGEIFAESHRLPEAAGEFSEALQFDPANANVRSNLGVVLFQLGKYEEAARQFSYALQIDPTTPNAREGLAAAQARMKNGSK
jgi:tetratricopeptide (TPR) repeat protein